MSMGKRVILAGILGGVEDVLMVFGGAHGAAAW
jgi:hypothetical protein